MFKQFSSKERSHIFFFFLSEMSHANARRSENVKTRLSELEIEVSFETTAGHLRHMHCSPTLQLETLCRGGFAWVYKLF